METTHFLFKKNTPRWIIYCFDLAIVALSIVVAYLLRFNFRIPDNEIPLIKYAAFVIIGVRGLTFIFGRTYAGIIRYTSTDDARRILFICLIGSLFIGFSNVVSYIIDDLFIIPFSVVIIEFLLTSFAMITSRAFVKFMYEEIRNPSSDKSSVLIFGAGEAGVIAKRTIDKDAKSPFNVIGFVDDNIKKTKRRLENKPIFGGDSLREILHEQEVSHLIISPQNISKNRLKEIIELCLQQNVQVLNVPSASKWINGELSLKQIKQIKIEDLLGREPIKLSKDKIREQLKEKVVMVTGAAGSIGSEIVRQIIKYSPKKVLMVDQAESALYELEMEFSGQKTISCVEIVIGDVRNKDRMENIFKTFRPDIVYHAAAYKHVPLMENNPSEAVLTNILGSKISAELSIKYEVETFVMISTDKAVNPTNVMGASKRISEIYIQSLNSTSRTKFITTRFGNVLGSNGSVIPLFKKQIENGGPITVTHPEITRYFMTIPEACQLVLEAGTAGKGGEVFIFDMGNSIKIKDLASQMIRLSGLEEGKDIQIVYTGLRPGEKLYEELLNDKENTIATHHPQIMIAKVQEYEISAVLSQIEKIISYFPSQNNKEMVRLMKQLVPEYKSKNSVYQELDEVE